MNSPRARSAFLPFLLLLAACTPARFSIYSRPGGAEVLVDGRFVARTVNEAQAVKVEVQPGDHAVRVTREGFEPWERTVKAFVGRDVAVMADLAAVPPPPVYIPQGGLEIRTTPGGARLSLDGRVIGRTKEDGTTPVLVEKMAPGRYVLRVEKEGYGAHEERYEIFANQVSRAAVRLLPLKPYYCFPNNSDLLRQTTLRAVRGVAHLPGMRTSKTIAVVDLDGPDANPVGLRALVEDAIIAELVQKGRAVAERGDHLLVRIANEAARGETLTLDVLTKHEGPDRPFLYDARLRTFADAAVLVTENRGGGARQILVRDRSTPPEARIPAADQVLGYKIVEETLRVDPVDRPGDEESMLRREAILRLYVRLIDARTGVVHWAERFEASLLDHVPVRVYRWLETPPERLYAYEEPAGPARPVVTGAETMPVDVIEASDLGLMNDADALFWYYRNVGESYLRAGRASEAVRLLDEATALRPGDYEARMFLAEARLSAGDLDGAARDFREAFRRLTAPEN